MRDLLTQRRFGPFFLSQLLGAFNDNLFKNALVLLFAFEVAASSEMMPGVVSLPHGWGHARPGVQLAIARAQAGASANDLTDERHLDLLSGNAALNGLPVEVEAA